MTARAAVHPRPWQVWGELDQATRNAAYDNAAAVEGSRDFMAALRADSAAFRAAHADRRCDVQWGASERHRWNIYPAADVNAPCLVFIFGGYWQWNDPEHFACLASGVMAHGWSVAMPGYTLVPAASLQDIVREIHSGLDWLMVHGLAHGIGRRLVVSGWSAGGTLAALALDHPAIMTGLALSGIYELGPLRDTALNAALSLSDAEIAGLSPLRREVSSKTLAIAYGSRELPALCRSSRAFHHVRSVAHCPGPLVPMAGADHFSVLQDLRQPDGELVRCLRSMV